MNEHFEGGKHRAAVDLLARELYELGPYTRTSLFLEMPLNSEGHPTRPSEPESWGMWAKLLCEPTISFHLRRVQGYQAAISHVASERTCRIVVGKDEMNIREAVLRPRIAEKFPFDLSEVKVVPDICAFREPSWKLDQRPVVVFEVVDRSPVPDWKRVWYAERDIKLRVLTIWNVFDQKFPQPQFNLNGSRLPRNGDDPA